MRTTKDQIIRRLKKENADLRASYDSLEDRINREYTKTSYLEKVPRFENAHLQTLLTAFENIVSGLCHAISDIRQCKR